MLNDVSTKNNMTYYIFYFLKFVSRVIVVIIWIWGASGDNLPFNCWATPFYCIFFKVSFSVQ